MPPDEYRSEGTPSLSEGPYVRGETFWFLLCRSVHVNVPVASLLFQQPIAALASGRSGFK
jgi:hypothetical protein